jgi:hypothetical protein
VGFLISHSMGKQGKLARYDQQTVLLNKAFELCF